MSDDGIGPKVIERLREVGVPDGVELLDAHTSALDVVPYIDGKRFAVFIDAVSAGGEPGSVYRMTLDDLSMRSRPILSLHSFCLEDAARLWRILVREMPRVVIFGVEPKVVEPGLELSAEVAQAVPKVCDLVVRELENARVEPGAGADEQD